MYLVNVRKQKQNEFEYLISRYKELVKETELKFTKEIHKYSEEIGMHSEAIKNLEKLTKRKDEEINQLKNHLMLLESNHLDIPIPRWLKDGSGKMLFLNQAYEKEILAPLGKIAKDYLNKTDKEFWGDQIATIFNDNDLKVIRTRKAEEFIETWKGLNNITYEGRVLKYPRYIGNNKTIIGIGGLIIKKWIKT